MRKSVMPVNEESVTPPAWRLHVQRVCDRIENDPNMAIADFKLYFQEAEALEAVYLLTKLDSIIRGAQGEAATRKRRITLGSLRCAVTQALEEDESFKSFEGEES